MHDRDFSLQVLLQTDQIRRLHLVTEVYIDFAIEQRISWMLDFSNLTDTISTAAFWRLSNGVQAWTRLPHMSTRRSLPGSVLVE